MKQRQKRRRDPKHKALLDRIDRGMVEMRNRQEARKVRRIKLAAQGIDVDGLARFLNALQRRDSKA